MSTLRVLVLAFVFCYCVQNSLSTQPPPPPRASGGIAGVNADAPSAGGEVDQSVNMYLVDEDEPVVGAYVSNSSGNLTLRTGPRGEIKGEIPPHWYAPGAKLHVVTIDGKAFDVTVQVDAGGMPVTINLAHGMTFWDRLLNTATAVITFVVDHWLVVLLAGIVVGIMEWWRRRKGRT